MAELKMDALIKYPFIAGKMGINFAIINQLTQPIMSGSSRELGVQVTPDRVFVWDKDGCTDDTLSSLGAFVD